jgi:hypothetical protein
MSVTTSMQLLGQQSYSSCHISWLCMISLVDKTSLSKQTQEHTFVFLLFGEVWAGVAQSLWRLATRWTVRGSNSRGDRFFRTCPARPVAQPTCYLMGTGSFPGVKRPGHDIDHPPHLGPRLKKDCNCTSTPFLGLHDLFYGKRYLYLLCGDKVRKLCLLLDIIQVIKSRTMGCDQHERAEKCTLNFNREI